ncbi:MAG: hypothetical protein D6710_04715 [Nitrospirae bacterium]|nr:MAG: hypothetical protein D6710_04715 [Nitrospirota bacterium]
MKTNVVETGFVLKTDGELATVQIKQGKSCKGCAMGKLGMCRPGGAGMRLKVKNPVKAEVGDTVMIGIDKKTHSKGYFIVFIFPLLILFISTIIGYYLSTWLELKGLEIITGFTGLGVSIFYSLNRIHRMDKEVTMYIKRIVQDVPEFSWEANYGAEGGDYLSGFAEKEKRLN